VVIEQATQDFYFRFRQTRMVVFDKGDWILNAQFPDRSASSRVSSIRRLHDADHAVEALAAEGSDRRAVPRCGRHSWPRATTACGAVALALGKWARRPPWTRWSRAQGHRRFGSLACVEAFGSFYGSEAAAPGATGRKRPRLRRAPGRSGIARFTRSARAGAHKGARPGIKPQRRSQRRDQRAGWS
jgi:hypothetical protein